MIGVDPEIESSVLRMWLAVGSVAMLLAAGALFLMQRQKIAPASVLRSVMIVLVTVLVTSTAWIVIDHYRSRDGWADRPALESRAEHLSGLALVPGSPLACLDGLAGDSVEAACEKVLFASPATVAAAISYDAARFALLADMIAYTRRGGADIKEALQPLRRSLEADRFGFLAQMLAASDGCTSQDCKALALLPDSSRVRANLRGQTLDHYIEHYQTVWAETVDGPVAEAAHPEPSATAQLVPPGQHKVLVNIDFPTAASIPPISIMNPEPDRPAARALRKQSGGAADQAHAQGAASAAAGSQAQPDRVWTPTPAAPPPQPAAAAPAANQAAGVPVQLNPFPSSH